MLHMNVYPLLFVGGWVRNGGRMVWVTTHQPSKRGLNWCSCWAFFLWFWSGAYKKWRQQPHVTAHLQLTSCTTLFRLVTLLPSRKLTYHLQNANFQDDVPLFFQGYYICPDGCRGTRIWMHLRFQKPNNIWHKSKRSRRSQIDTPVKLLMT